MTARCTGCWLSYGSTPPALLPLLSHLPELALQSRPLWPIGHIGHPFAKFVLSVPEVLAMLRVLGRGNSAIPRRGRRRPTNCDLANPWYRDLSLSVS